MLTVLVFKLWQLLPTFYLTSCRGAGGSIVVAWITAFIVPPDFMHFHAIFRNSEIPLNSFRSFVR